MTLPALWLGFLVGVLFPPIPLDDTGMIPSFANEPLPLPPFPVSALLELKSPSVNIAHNTSREAKLDCLNSIRLDETTQVTRCCVGICVE